MQSKPVYNPNSRSKINKYHSQQVKSLINYWSLFLARNRNQNLRKEGEKIVVAHLEKLRNFYQALLEYENAKN